MAAFRLLVLCSVVVAATCQGRQGTPVFCLKLLRSDNPGQVSQALRGCINKVQSNVEKTGREFKLAQEFGSLGRCIAETVGLVSSSGQVNKAQLRQRIVNSKAITEQERAFYLGLVPTCDNWDGCLRKHCSL